MPTVDFNPEKMRARFWEIKGKREAIRAKADPLRQQRDELVASHAAEEAKINKRIAAAEEGLFDLDQEAAMIARALGGRMGEPV